MSRSTSAVLAIVMLLVTAPARSDEKLIRNYATWTDTAGNPISCHDGGITRVGDTFYWYGTTMRRASR